jgi:hypothetical protein
VSGTDVVLDLLDGTLLQVAGSKLDTIGTISQRGRTPKVLMHEGYAFWEPTFVSAHAAGDSGIVVLRLDDISHGGPWWRRDPRQTQFRRFAVEVIGLDLGCLFRATLPSQTGWRTVAGSESTLVVGGVADGSSPAAPTLVTYRWRRREC